MKSFVREDGGNASLDRLLCIFRRNHYRDSWRQSTSALQRAVEPWIDTIKLIGRMRAHDYRNPGFSSN